MDETLVQYEQLWHTLAKWLSYYFVAAIVLETIYLLVKFKTIYPKTTTVNLISGFAAIGTQALVKTYIIKDLHFDMYRHHIFEIGIHWYTWVIGFFMYTFIQFATHYYNHKVRLFWCLHEVHHSAVHMNFTTGLRTSVFDVISLDIFYVLIPLCGVHPLVYFILYTLNKFWGNFIHINESIVSRIPILENILVSPAAHHIHHARNIPYLDKNYGEIIPWFDMVFKTYARKKEDPVYGTLSIHSEIGFWESQLHEFRKLRKDIKSTGSWKEKAGYLFMPPGWKPGSLEGTASYIQEQYALQNLSNSPSACRSDIVAA